MGQRGFAQSGRAVEQYMVQRFAPPPGGDDGYAQVFLNFVLSDEVIKATRP